MKVSVTHSEIEEKIGTTVLNLVAAAGGFPSERHAAGGGDRQYEFKRIIFGDLEIRLLKEYQSPYISRNMEILVRDQKIRITREEGWEGWFVPKTINIHNAMEEMSQLMANKKGIIAMSSFPQISRWRQEEKFLECYVSLEKERNNNSQIEIESSERSESVYVYLRTYNTKVVPDAYGRKFSQLNKLTSEELKYRFSDHDLPGSPSRRVQACLHIVGGKIARRIPAIGAAICAGFRHDEEEEFANLHHLVEMGRLPSTTLARYTALADSRSMAVSQLKAGYDGTMLVSGDITPLDLEWIEGVDSFDSFEFNWVIARSIQRFYFDLFVTGITKRGKKIMFRTSLRLEDWPVFKVVKTHHRFSTLGGDSARSVAGVIIKATTENLLLEVYAKGEFPLSKLTNEGQRLLEIWAQETTFISWVNNLVNEEEKNKIFSHWKKENDDYQRRVGS